MAPIDGTLEFLYLIVFDIKFSNANVKYVNELRHASTQKNIQTTIKCMSIAFNVSNKTVSI